MSNLIHDIVATTRTSTRGLHSGLGPDKKYASWAEVHQQAVGMSERLAAQGIGRHYTVAILAGDTSDVAPLAQALWIRGAALTMLQHPTPRIDLAVWISDTARAARMLGASLIIVGTPFEAAIPALQAEGLLVVQLDSLRGSGRIAPVESDDNDIAMRQLTSGSTGVPKAVEISHGNLVANIEAIRVAVGLDDDTVVASWLPLCHDMGMVGFLCVPMNLGLETIAVRPEEFLRKPIVWAEMITDFRVNVTAGPNFAYSVLARMLERADPETIDLSSLRVAINGAEPINHVDIARFSAVGARFGMGPGVATPFYGLAEATLAVSAGDHGAPAVVDHVSGQLLTEANRAEQVSADADDARHVVCVGLPIHGMEVRVVSDDTTLSTRDVGAIQLRGPSIAGSYLTTDGVVKLADDDGWFDTGDIGYLDERGRVYVCGRTKDLIVLAGRNLYPHDIERAAATVEGVRQGCVVALRTDSDREGFAVLAEVYDRYDEQARTQIRRDITAQVSGHVGHTPREVLLLAPGSLPKTTSGKLRRTSARALLNS